MSPRGQHSTPLLLDGARNIEARDAAGASALQLAVCQRTASLEEYDDSDSDFDMDAWHYDDERAECRHNCLVALLDAKASINGANDKTGDTALHVAMRLGDEMSAETLIKRGCSLGAKNKHSHTALLTAALLGRDDFCTMLLDAKARATATDSFGQSVLAMAQARKFQPAVMTAICTWNAPPEAKKEKTTTTSAEQNNNPKKAAAFPWTAPPTRAERRAAKKAKRLAAEAAAAATRRRLAAAAAAEDDGGCSCGECMGNEW
jgi:ankyrin repeat protein